MQTKLDTKLESLIFVLCQVTTQIKLKPSEYP
jgi:hypothetical protein